MALRETLTLNKALLYFMLLGIVMGIQVNLAKGLSLTYRASYITFIRCVSFSLAIPFVEWNDVNHHCNIRDLAVYIAASAIIVIPFGTMTFSYKFLGAGDSNAIEFGAGLILTAIIGHVVLKETISFLYFMLLLVNCAGVVLVAKPQLIFGDSQVAATSREIGMVIAFLGACFAAVWPILLRPLAIRETLYCFTMTAMQGLVGMVLVGLWCTLDSGWTTPTTWLSVCLFVAYGASSIAQCVFAIKVLQHAKAKDLAVSMTISVVISYILQVTFFGEEMDMIRILGVVVIIVCVFVSTSWIYLESMLQKHFRSGDADGSSDNEEAVTLVTGDG